MVGVYIRLGRLDQNFFKFQFIQIYKILKIFSINFKFLIFPMAALRAVFVFGIGF